MFRVGYGRHGRGANNLVGSCEVHGDTLRSRMRAIGGGIEGNRTSRRAGRHGGGGRRKIERG